MLFFNVIHALTSFVDRLILLALGAAMVAHGLLPSLFDGLSLRELAGRWPGGWMGAGAILIGLNLMPLLEVAVRGRGQAGYLVSGSASGPARVSLRAVRRSLHAAAQAVPGVRRARLVVQRLGPRHYRIGVRYWIENDGNAIAAGERLRLVLARRLAELVSLDPKHRVEIEVSLAGLVEGGASGAGGTASGTEPAGFHGPVYPVVREKAEDERVGGA